jgi:hypothetical protein
MTGLLIGLAVITAVFVVGARAAWKRAAERAQPGRSPRTAIPVHDYAEIDIAVRMQTCHCGGHFVVRSEGPARNADHLRIAFLECRQCEKERRMYFDLSTIRH